jgi:hypothetical protein
LVYDPNGTKDEANHTDSGEDAVSTGDTPSPAVRKYDNTTYNNKPNFQENTRNIHFCGLLVNSTLPISLRLVAQQSKLLVLK